MVIDWFKVERRPPLVRTPTGTFRSTHSTPQAQVNCRIPLDLRDRATAANISYSKVLTAALEAILMEIDND